MYKKAEIIIPFIPLNHLNYFTLREKKVTTYGSLKLRLQCRSCQQMDHLHNQGKPANPKRKKLENLRKKYNKFRGLTKYFRAMNNFLWEHQDVLRDTKMFAGQYKDVCGWYINICAPKINICAPK